MTVTAYADDDAGYRRDTDHGISLSADDQRDELGAYWRALSARERRRHWRNASEDERDLLREVLGTVDVIAALAAIVAVGREAGKEAAA